MNGIDFRGIDNVVYERYFRKVLNGEYRYLHATDRGRIYTKRGALLVDREGILCEDFRAYVNSRTDMYCPNYIDSVHNEGRMERIFELLSKFSYTIETSGEPYLGALNEVKVEIKEEVSIITDDKLSKMFNTFGYEIEEEDLSFMRTLKSDKISLDGVQYVLKELKDIDRDKCRQVKELCNYVNVEEAVKIVNENEEKIIKESMKLIRLKVNVKEAFEIATEGTTEQYMTLINYRKTLRQKRWHIDTINLFRDVQNNGGDPSIESKWIKSEIIDVYFDLSMLNENLTGNRNMCELLTYLYKKNYETDVIKKMIIAQHFDPVDYNSMVFIGRVIKKLIKEYDGISYEKILSDIAYKKVV